MTPRGLNTMLVQRIETALGVPLSQESRIAREPASQAVHPLGKALSVQATESSTHKPVFAKEVADRADARTVAPTDTRAAKATEAATQSMTRSSDTTKALPSPSTRMQLSHVGRMIYSLFEQFPHGAGPIRGDRPLFMSAVMHLREQAMSRAMSSGALPTGADQKPAPKTDLLTNSLPSSSTLSGSLALMLQQAIVQSGLFYEAQLIRALHGNQRQLELLKAQPQGQASAGSVIGEDASTEELNLPARVVVRQQLDVLSNQVIQWQGQAWPGVDMDWEMRPWTETDVDWGESKDADRDDGSESVWCSTISLDMPNLGKVKVKIWVSGQTTRLIIVPEGNAEALSASSDQLHQRLEQAGINATQIDIAPPSKEQL